MDCMLFPEHFAPQRACNPSVARLERNSIVARFKELGGLLVHPTRSMASPPTQICFAFQNTGRCDRALCRFLHGSDGGSKGAGLRRQHRRAARTALQLKTVR